MILVIKVFLREWSFPPCREEVSTMTVKQLKSFLAQQGVDSSDCIEKADLIAKAKSLI